MNITYHPTKDATNLAKHGVSLALAVQLEWDTLWAKPDNRRNYGEARMIGYAILSERLYCVVFTDRGADRHVISLRKANPREVRSYATNP